MIPKYKEKTPGDPGVPSAQLGEKLPLLPLGCPALCWLALRLPALRRPALCWLALRRPALCWLALRRPALRRLSPYGLPFCRPSFLSWHNKWGKELEK